MFRLHRPKSQKLGERLDFKLSTLQALQVPKGWDKLLVSVVSVETGKTLTKSGKASVRNGNCQWTETLSESISISQNENSKDMKDCLIRLIVAMGSGRFGILGEATINLTNYRSSKTAVLVSLPLKKCNHGTILQVKINCLIARAKIREEQWEDTGSYTEDANLDYDDIETKSDVSDSSYTRSVGSSSSKHFDTASQTGEPLTRESSLSASGSRCSLDSVEGLGRENYSPQSNMTGFSNSRVGRQDSTGSQNGFPYGSPFNDSFRSNHSSFNSKVSASRSHLQSQRDDLNHISHAVASSPLQNAGLSKDLIEAAEVTIDELRAEAKMWEKNSQKLMTDVETLQKELLKQSNFKASIEVDLSESRRECDGLKEEIEQLKILLEESIANQKGNEHVKFQAKEMDNIQKELEDEVRFLKESNANLDIQLKKTQESNIELVSILQELEDTIEKQKMQIADLSKTEINNEYTGKFSFGFEENDEIKKQDLAKTEKRASVDLNLKDDNVDGELRELRTGLDSEQFQESQRSLQDTILDLEKSLNEKNHEIEAEQNLKKKALVDSETEWRDKLAVKQEEIVSLEAKLSEALNAHGSRNGSNHDLVNEIEVLKQKMEDLENDCNELTEENLELLHKLKQSRNSSCSNFLPDEFPETDALSGSESEVSKMNLHICRLEEELNKKEILIEELSTDHSHLQIQHDNLVRNYADQQLQLQASEEKVNYLNEELYKHRAKVEGLEMEIAAFIERLECNNRKKTETTDHPVDVHTDFKVSATHPVADVAETLSELHGHIQLCLANVREQNHNLCFSVDTQSSYDTNQSQILDNTYSAGQKEQAEAILKNFLQLKELLEAKVEVKDSDEKVLEKVSGLSELNSDNSSKEQEVKSLRDCQRELETQISNLRNEKKQLEENMDVELNEGLDDLQNQIVALNRSMDSQVSSNSELETHLSELEKENVELSERICGLEAQLIYLTNERESNRLVLQNSECSAVNLQEEVNRLQSELEAQKADMKQKIQDIQNKWLEAQEECNHLKISNTKLQTTAESLIEESSVLQKSYIELRKQKMELFDHSTVLEAELRESNTLCANTLSEIEYLEEKYIAMLEEIASKEKALCLELDTLIQDNQKHKEKLVMQESLLNQIYLEKIVEVDNLKTEIAHLKEQVSATHDGKEKTGSDVMLEMSRLRAEKAMLEAGLEEVQGKLRLSEKNFSTLQMESETKMQRIIDELAASKQNEEVLMADHEKLLDLMEDVKSKEERHKSIVRGLELKLKTSEYERLQAAEEVSSLSAQLQKTTALLQNEILFLKRTLDVVKFENQRLEASHQILSVDYEELKTEKTLSIQKISNMQRSLSELENCRHSKVSLEEKVFRLEGDLTAREALGAQSAGLKNELARVKREKCELQRKISYLEEEHKECLKRSQGFQEVLKQEKEEKQDHHHQSTDVTSSPDGLKQSQHDTQSCGSVISTLDPLVKIQLLENELAEALEANDMYKSQLKSFLSERCEDSKNGLKKLTDEAAEVVKDGDESITASDDAQLKDLQERYFHLSLKYAEVEGEREQLVLKLKASNSGRGWFS